MKILMISHFIPYPPHGGAIQRTFNLLRETARKHEVHLITFSQKAIQPDPRKIAENIKELEKYCKTVKVIDISSDNNILHRLLLLAANVFSNAPFDVWRFKSKNMARAIKDALANNKFDIFHAETIGLAQYKKLAPDMPSLLVHHNVESVYILRRGKSEKNPLAQLYLFLQGIKIRAYERKMMPLFDMNIAVSDLDMLNFQERIPNGKIRVITNGTDPEYFKPTSDIEESALIFTGGLTWYPNRDAMHYFCERVFPLIKKSTENIRLDIIGRSPSEDLLKYAAADESIKIHGYVDDIRSYVARAAVYIVPIRVGGGTRLKILDAFAAGKAVVSTSIGCEGLHVEDGKNILLADSDQEFADKVLRLLKDKKLRGDLGSNARQLIQDYYSWEILGRNLNQIYQELNNAKT